MTVSRRRTRPTLNMIGSSLLLASGLASAGMNGDTDFAITDLPGGYLLAQKAETEGKCGEGKCGGDAKGEAEGKCGEGKCGGDADAKDAAEGKCGEGKCGEGKCGGESRES